MQFLPHVIQESLRLYATVPYVTRKATSTVHLKDNGMSMTIPEGTSILIPLYLLNREATVWPQPAKFNPDRFQNYSFVSTQQGYFPFGYGPRACVGSVFAQIELSLLVIQLLRGHILYPDVNVKVGIKAGHTLAPSGTRILVERIPA
jgi:cytochrome P450